MNDRLSIPELDEVSYINGLAEAYRQRYGSVPFDVSHWNPSESTLNNMLKFLVLPAPPLASPYIYSYYLNEREAILKALRLRN